MRFYSSGKLLIAGEYLVLKGAKALAVPLTKGQDLNIKKTQSTGNLLWNSYVSGNTWFTATINTAFFHLLETSDPKLANDLINILKAARELNPDFLADWHLGYKIDTHLEFEREWGFGSSSSLLSNIAYVAEIDPMALHQKVSKGSGYDVITARQNGPVYFQLNFPEYTIEKVDFYPDFKSQLFFIYLGTKQRSDVSVSRFLENKNQYKKECIEVSEIAEKMATTQSLTDFEYAVRAHEQLIGRLLKAETLKQSRFKDLPGEVKALGAWGGDFAMISWNESINKLKDYLTEKNIDTFFTFENLVKNN